jgi:hypothetical protein
LKYDNAAATHVPCFADYDCSFCCLGDSVPAATSSSIDAFPRPWQRRAEEKSNESRR